MWTNWASVDIIISSNFILKKFVKWKIKSPWQLIVRKMAINDYDNISKSKQDLELTRKTINIFAF